MLGEHSGEIDPRWRIMLLIIGCTVSAPQLRAFAPFRVADHPPLNSPRKKNSSSRTDPTLAQPGGMYICTRTLTSIFSIAAALFGQLAYAASGGVIAPLSPTSFVTGKAFDRFVVIWLENTVISPIIRDIWNF